ncbi:hypothetical protein V502_09383 [Pseudogymnoascus sp. VKM F-4520 (FW-2644)]|nr:hypothetical protein V502_09383 [Pseudogymnoascus sp. VKM F-4520 (FW-2644)]
MPPHDGYDRPSRRNRGAVGHWMPLILTVAVATIGFATWVWSERDDDDEDKDDRRRRRDGRRDDYRDPQGPPPTYSDPRSGEQGYGAPPRHAEEPSSYVARALKRTPSPQQFLEGASRTVSAGITAAGAAVGNALSSIREEDKNAYKDHKTWSEEAEARGAGASPTISPVQTKSVTAAGKGASNNGKKIKVAVVVSADADLDGVDDGLDYSQTHASILSYLPTSTDFSRIQLFVLIFSPDLKHHPLDAAAAKPAGSLSSSFSNIDPDQALTPAEEGEKAIELDPTTPAFNALWTEAEDVVEKKTMIFPFTTQGGHVHILRHLAPDVIYLQEALSGKEGDVITHLQTWLRGDVVVVVGGDHGVGGLADSESEAEQATPEQKVEKWWEKEERVGRGRHVFVVENLRVGDDWSRRIEGKD